MEKQFIESLRCLKIDKKHPDFEGLYWVIGARHMGDNRFGLEKILCQKGRLVATDGFRMHIYKIQDSDNIPEGTYMPIVRNAGFILLSEVPEDNYLNYKKVFPRAKENIILKNIWIGRNRLDNTKNFALVLKNIPETVVMQYWFFLDLATDGWTVSVYDGIPEGPVKFESVNHNKMALIMPIRI